MIFLTYNISVALVLVFLYNFFPFKISNTKKNINPPRKIGDISFNLDKVFKPEVDRLIFIVIDALRYDFITEDNMPRTIQAMKNTGCLFKVQTHSPTVTLPRIKSLTVGNIPQFADVVFNLVATEQISDSFLHQVRNQGKKVIFYGDDTWLKLYPDLFLRSEGVSSFFVNDFYEVDNNVTKSLRRELNNEDWDIMFLHYLGLDHIGHVYGPFSSLIKPKLLELDDIIDEIYNASHNWDGKTLIMVTGDHGMKDSGGHGGSTHSEITVPLVTIGLECEGTEIDQTDIPITLSYLFGTRIVRDSVGQLITTLKSFNTYKILYMLRYNAINLIGELEIIDELFLKANKSHYNYLKYGNTSEALLGKEYYELYLNKLTKLLVNTVGDENESLLNLICVILICCTIINVAILIQKYYFIYFSVLLFLGCLLISKQRLVYSSIFFFCASLYFYNLYNKLQKGPSKVQPSTSISKYFIASLTYLEPITFFSSSFIEEEHQIWYFYVATAVVLVVYQFYSTKHHDKFIFGILIGIAFCILKKLNQTGDKWASLPDLNDWFLKDENFLFYHLYILSSFIILFITCLKLCDKNKFNIVLLILIILNNYMYRIFNLMLLPKIIWVLILMQALLNIFFKFITFRKSFILFWILTNSLLLRSHNVILLSCCVYFSKFIINYLRSPLRDVSLLTFGHLWLGNALFFCQGHSNSISSIDVASGYVGLNNYVPSIVFTLVLCHTYTFPVLAIILLFNEVHSSNYKSSECMNVWNFLYAYRLFNITICIISCIIQKQHLFIWTVFAPKLLIESSHCVVLCFISYMYSLCISLESVVKKTKIK